MFKFEHLKETIIAVFISSAILGHEMILKLSIPSSIISGSNWENLKHIELQSNLLVCMLINKECIHIITSPSESK